MKSREMKNHLVKWNGCNCANGEPYGEKILESRDFVDYIECFM